MGNGYHKFCDEPVLLPVKTCTINRANGCPFTTHGQTWGEWGDALKTRPMCLMSYCYILGFLFSLFVFARRKQAEWKRSRRKPWFWWCPSWFRLPFVGSCFGGSRAAPEEKPKASETRSTANGSRV